MTSREPLDRERLHALMMAAIDGEIAAGDRQELETALAGSPELEREWCRFVRLKEVTTTMTLQNPPEELWDRYWHGTYRRFERGIAWILLSAGGAVLGGYWLWHAIETLLAETDVPLFLRLALLAVLLGSLILLVSVIREKLFTNRRDPYGREVIR